MQQQTATKTVEYNQQNVSMCQCGKCPVQAASSCVSGKMQELKQSGEMMPQDPKKLPGLYCGSGTSTCNDLNAKEQCVCPTCGVWQAHDLANYKYCLNGSAQQIG